MKILRLSLSRPASGVPAEVQPWDCANGSPCFGLITTPRLPARRLFQGLAADVVLFVGALTLAYLFGTSAVKDPVRPHDKPIRITLYDPRPAKEHPSSLPVSRVKKNEGRRFSLPRKTIQPVTAPALDPPPAVLDARANSIPQIPDEGLPLPPAPALAILQVRVGAPKAPAAPAPSLGASPPRAAGFTQYGTNTGRDPLALAGTRSFGQGSGAEGLGGGPPDLSPKLARAAERAQMQFKSAPFTKPEILFMPKPTYPPAALAEKIEGDVSLEVTFEKSGRVIFRRFIRQLQNTDLNSIARDTAERIKFVPAMRNDVPVDQDSIVTVFFRLSQLNMTASF
jgi:TonB family protein